MRKAPEGRFRGVTQAFRAVLACKRPAGGSKPCEVCVK